MKRSNWLAAGVAATLVFACATDKEPAQQAVANLENGLSAIHDSAAKYAPDTLQTVEAQVATLKQKGTAEVAFRVEVKKGKVAFTARALKGAADEKK